VVNSHARSTTQDSAAFLLPHLKPHYAILDISCGPGTITADLAELVPDGKVTRVNAVEAVLERARAHVAGRSNITNYTFKVADINTLTYPDASFDVVFCH
jgi:ubiquinone/menaquinone biosynthesis C-methylase UbiE